MRKQERQAAITELIARGNISNQDELQRELQDQGIATTLATLSRDFRELHIVKEPTANGKSVYRMMAQAKTMADSGFQTQFHDVVLSITQVEFINVVKTTPSDGNALAALIDNLDEVAITGTLAGHDTILVISSSKELASELNQTWSSYLN